MKFKWISSLLLMVILVLEFAMGLHGGQIVAKSIQEATRISDLVLIGKVTAVEDTGKKDPVHPFKVWRADCTVSEVVAGDFSGKKVKVKFLVKAEYPQTSLPETDRLELEKTYILFLKRDGQELSLSNPWDCLLAVQKEYGIWDEDLKNNENALKTANSSIDGVPHITITHDALINKIKKFKTDK